MAVVAIVILMYISNGKEQVIYTNRVHTVDKYVL